MGFTQPSAVNGALLPELKFEGVPTSITLLLPLKLLANPNFPVEEIVVPVTVPSFEFPEESQTSLPLTQVPLLPSSICQSPTV